MAQTKITQLQAGINDRDDTIKIMSLRIKALEDTEFTNLRAQYFNQTAGNTSTSATGPGNTATPPTSPSSPAAAPGNPANISPTSPPPPATVPIEQVLTELATLKQHFTALQDFVVRSVSLSSVPPAAPSQGTGAAVTTAPGAGAQTGNTSHQRQVNIRAHASSRSPVQPPKSRPYPPPRQHLVSPWLSHQGHPPSE